jgi:UDP-N-acetyl-2-amino-2-deoxyglucuronate dehydrogenase
LSLSKIYNVGIVGCGAISPVHAQAIGEARNARLTSVYSRNFNSARKLGEQFKIPFYSDWDAFIGRTDLESVSICTPSGTHLDYTKLAAEAGKQIIVEKPLEVNIKRGKSLIEVCEKNGVNVAVIFQNRFIPKVQEMKNRMTAGELGKIFLGDAYIKWYRDQNYYDSGDWRGTLALDGGGALINQSIHTIDLLQWLMGEVDTVFGQTAIYTHERIEGEDTGVAVLRFKSGAMGMIEGSTSIYPARARKIEIHGEKGSAILDGDDLEIQILDSKIEKKESKQKKPAMGAASPFADFDIQPHKRQFEAIFDAFSQGKEPIVSGLEALKSLSIVQAIYESSRTGKVVKISDLLK